VQQEGLRVAAKSSPGAAELETLELDAPSGQEGFRLAQPAAKRGAYPALQPREHPALSPRLLELVQQSADPVDQLQGAAQVEPPLAPRFAPGQLEVRSQMASAVGAPVGDDRALGSE